MAKYCTPLPKSGAFMPKPVADWIKESLSNLEVVDLGEGVHFLQKGHTPAITEHLTRWIRAIPFY